MFQIPTQRLAIGWCLAVSFAAMNAHATSRVEAVAGSVSDFQNGPTAITATAIDGSLAATTTRTAGSSTGTTTGAFTAGRIPVTTKATSEFAVVGLIGVVPLTFNWTFSGSRSWDPNSASVGIGMSAGMGGGNLGFINIVGWGISYVDGPVNQGDFAGVLESPFGVTAAGNFADFSSQLPAGTWNGQGSRNATSVIQFAQHGTAGEYEIQVSLGLSGNVTASYALTLSSVTVASAAQLAPGAHLALDDGSQIAITAVPEPQTWAMLLAGVLVLGSVVRRRV